MIGPFPCEEERKVQGSGTGATRRAETQQERRIAQESGIGNRESDGRIKYRTEEELEREAAADGLNSDNPHRRDANHRLAANTTPRLPPAAVARPDRRRLPDKRPTAPTSSVRTPSANNLHSFLPSALLCFLFSRAYPSPGIGQSNNSVRLERLERVVRIAI